MTPPKITRPAVPEVKHEFPAYYVFKRTQEIFLMQSPNRGTDMVSGVPASGLADCTDSANWERLPSGSKIEFTQP